MLLAQLLSTLIIRNVSWVANEHIEIYEVYEGSCDTEDRNISAETLQF